MRFVSYNIRYGLGQDGRYDLARAVAAVAEADVIAFQEVEVNWPRTGMVDQARAIGELLPRHYWVHGPAFDVDASERAADGRVINRRRQFGTMIASRTPILASRLLVLPKLATVSEFNMANPALEGVVALPGGGAVRVLSLHLTHLTEEERVMQIDAILAWQAVAVAQGGAWTGRDEPDIEDWAIGEAPPMPAEAMLMGDFNSEPEGRIVPRVLAAGYVDTWAAAGKGSAPCPTWTPYPHSPIRRDRRLDYAFATPGLGARVRNAWVDREAVGSDHFPYWVEVEG
jgi:endonuclease/exonuclease/phosphatase family metal-dependent hydrolase